jgi:hypothetical protein
MKKTLPTPTSDAQAEAFVAEADLTEYDLSEMQMVQLAFQPEPDVPTALQES